LRGRTTPIFQKERFYFKFYSFLVSFIFPPSGIPWLPTTFLILFGLKVATKFQTFSNSSFSEEEEKKMAKKKKNKKK